MWSDFLFFKNDVAAKLAVFRVDRRGHILRKDIFSVMFWMLFDVMGETMELAVLDIFSTINKRRTLTTGLLAIFLYL